MMKSSFLMMVMVLTFSANAQTDRWQQKVKYTINVDMDVQKNQFKGQQALEYSNNSPDTLHRVFFHLYWNAFQPGSMMDMKSLRQGSFVRRDKEGNEIGDWDPRVMDRISQLKPEEIGYQNVSSIKMNGRVQKTKLHETILEVLLDKPILPQTKVVFDLDFDAQVPLQVRRSGRDNPETGIRFTMTQWYPKIAAYDNEGWHPTPYVGREFYGVWGDFDVTINIDRNYIIGGSGNLQNANTIGFGYEDKGVKVKQPSGKKLAWRFLAPNVHDFAWAADPGYKHIKKEIPNGPVIHVLYKNWEKDPVEEAKWKEMAEAAVTVYPFIKANFGEYPYRQYTFIQGGDGAMEYPMLATNESLYAWMDEGFTEYATNLVEEYYRREMVKKHLSNNPAEARKSDSVAFNAQPPFHNTNYTGYFNLVKSGREEPMSLHADHFNLNYAYSNAAYSKGAVFLEQLGYIIGAENRNKTLLEYYRQWRFKHPDATDFIRVAEKVSGIKLDWYKNFWVNTTRTIDYSIDSLWEQSGATNIRLRNIGMIPMPVDVKVSFKDGSSEWHYVPMYLMFGEKPAEKGQEPRKVYESWKWTHPTFQISSSRKLTDISTVEIDPSYRMADVDRKNNRLLLKW
jgi:hypothetical protein